MINEIDIPKELIYVYLQYDSPWNPIGKGILVMFSIS